jgi:hypothetical protein
MKYDITETEQISLKKKVKQRENTNIREDPRKLCLR